jgi:hypothetical protein
MVDASEVTEIQFPLPSHRAGRHDTAPYGDIGSRNDEEFLTL